MNYSTLICTIRFPMLNEWYSTQTSYLPHYKNLHDVFSSWVSYGLMKYFLVWFWPKVNRHPICEDSLICVCVCVCVGSFEMNQSQVYRRIKSWCWLDERYPCMQQLSLDMIYHKVVYWAPRIYSISCSQDFKIAKVATLIGVMKPHVDHI